MRTAVLWRLEELCLQPTPQQWQQEAVGSIGMNPVASAISAITSAADRYHHRRIRTTWDAVEWFQKNDPSFDWEAPAVKSR